MLRVLASSLLLILSVASVGAADADWRKLDARTRSALSRLRAGAPPARLTDVRAAVNAAGELDVFIVGPVTREELEAAGARVRTEAKGVFTAWVPAGAVAGVAALSRVRRIEGAVPVSPQLDASIPVTNVHIARGPGPAFAGFNGQGILLGVVDTGVDYGHGDFDDPSGNTRLIGVWDQTDTLGPSPLVTGTGPYPYGSDWAPAAIDDGSARETDTFPHGTHVLGIAGGDGSQTGGATPPFTYAGVAPRADLVMVETNFTSTGVVDGVRYVFDRATARDQNAVVNLSLGSQFGPHDGTSAFETSLSALTGPGRVVVAAAGNDRGRQYHAEVFAAGGGSDATLSVSNSATGREVVVAGYYESTENVSVRITTPDATVIGPIPLGGTNGATGQVTANGTVYVENGVSTSGGGDPEIFVDIEVGPGQNMNGIWTFTLIPVALGTANGEVDLWRAFSGNAHAVFVQGNDNSELVVEPGNADSLVTVAAFLTKTTWIDCGGRTVMDGTQPLGTLAGFSSPGPTRTGGQKPDLAGPGLDIASTTSFDVGPSCPPTESIYLNDGMNHFVDAGTSMAAPHVAGVVALLMQRYGAISPSFVKQYLAEHAIVDANTGAVWNPDWGHGKLFLGDLASTGVEPLPGADAEFTLALRPNPTAGPVTIEFAVARATDVRV
ncbi:MAG TPA: S8 family serine peptidase, partial [Candidatus Limnocylindria bacterium]|nr:S8 family serine peptidase [Candidatus Limnocylindria bacterium]